MNAQAVEGPLVLNPSLAESTLPRVEDRELYRATSGALLQRARALLNSWTDVSDIVQRPYGMAELLLALIESAPKRSTWGETKLLTTPHEALQYLEQVRHEVLYVAGRRICVEFKAENGQIDFGLYDAFNGKGLAERVVEKIRSALNATLSQAA